MTRAAAAALAALGLATVALIARITAGTTHAAEESAVARSAASSILGSTTVGVLFVIPESLRSCPPAAGITSAVSRSKVWAREPIR